MFLLVSSPSHLPNPQQCGPHDEPCGPGNQQCPSAGPRAAAPRFHIKDAYCDENDPNFPFYDPETGLYHLFYQAHLARPGPNVPSFAGPVIGHVVSHNLVHWARLPVALWNGPEWFDEVAVFTGSATVVDGQPVLVYPGVCRKGVHEGCLTGFTYAMAVASNTSDPLRSELLQLRTERHISCSSSKCMGP
jgi:sucrose-6-phosphate hydrolase SacC (GH32 family)